MDIVYVFKESETNDSDELRYSLRSLKNIPHNNVYIVGEKPSWLRHAIHISVKQNTNMHGDIATKYNNVANNLRTAANTPEISDDFMYMNDDFFIMKPFEKMPAYHWGPMRDIITRFMARYDEESMYIHRMKELYALLKSQGHDEPLSYELHVPIVLNKSRMQIMYSPEFNRIYQFRTMYGNHFNIGGEHIEDVKLYADERHNDPAYNKDPTGYLGSQALLSATASSFRSDAVGQFVRAAFKDKSPYEI